MAALSVYEAAGRQNAEANRGDTERVNAGRPRIWGPCCASSSRGRGLAALGPLPPGRGRGEHGCGYVRLRNPYPRQWPSAHGTRLRARDELAVRE